ncbi:MAG: phosphatase PAP2 family protein [Betaproteobacteria bacterium]
MTIQSLDTQLLLFINHHLANPAFDILMPALSRQGYLLVVPFLLAMFLSGTKQKDDRGKTYLTTAVWTFLIACVAVYLAGLAEDWMKDAVARVRPCRALEGLRLIVACPGSFAMPSGHAISSFAFAAPLFYLTREYIAMIWRLYPLILASLIAFSRLYLGVHYPTDVLAGAVLGAIIGLVLSFLYQVIVTEDFLRRRTR